MHQLLRLALRRNEVEPPPRHQQSRAQPKNAISQRVPVMMVIEQPASHLLIAQRSLNRSNIHAAILSGHRKSGVLIACLDRIAEARDRPSVTEFLTR
jgi:hypothetical protein